MNYRADFIDRVDVMMKAEEIKPTEVRVAEVDQMLEEYYEVTGDKPPGNVLEKMGNYLLLDTLRDRNPHKAKHSEYPVYSKYQQKLRRNKQILMGDDKLDWFKQRNLNNPNTRKVRRNNKDE